MSPPPKPPPSASRIPHSLLRVAIRCTGPILLVVLLARMDRNAITLALQQANLGPLIVAILLTFVNLQLKVMRWHILMRTQHIRYPHKRAWQAYLGSSYIGMLTPGRVGDAIRAQYLRHDQGVPYSEGLATVVMDRLYDLYVLGIFAAIGIVRFGPIMVGQLAYWAWTLVALTLLGPLVLLIPGVAEKLMSRIYNKVSAGTDASGLEHFLASLRSHLGRALPLNLVVTVLAFLVNYAQAWLLARGLHLNISLFDHACLLSIASLLSLLPISVSGIGLRELFFSAAFPTLHYRPEDGVTFGLLVFSAMHLVVIASGFISFQIAPPPVGTKQKGGRGQEGENASS